MSSREACWTLKSLPGSIQKTESFGDVIIPTLNIKGNWASFIVVTQVHFSEVSEINWSMFLFGGSFWSSLDRSTLDAKCSSWWVEPLPMPLVASWKVLLYLACRRTSTGSALPLSSVNGTLRSAQRLFIWGTFPTDSLHMNRWSQIASHRFVLRVTGALLHL